MEVEVVTPVEVAAVPVGLSFAEFEAYLDFAFASEAELIKAASKLNNHPALVGTDHVSFMGLMGREEMVRHVAKLTARISEAA